jgi:hypothetical protein
MAAAVQRARREKIHHKPGASRWVKPAKRCGGLILVALSFKLVTAKRV